MRRSSLFFIVLIAGIITLIVGIVIGFSSQQVSYQRIGRGKINHYLSANGTGYLQMVASPTLYIVKEKDFTPAIKGINTFVRGDEISFVYDPGDIMQINVQSASSHLSGTAYKIVQITSFIGNTPTNLTTQAYIQHPKGHYSTQWDRGLILIVSGLLLMGISFFFSKKQIRQNAKSTQASSLQQPAVLYHQPPMGNAQYPQQLQGPFAAQAGWYQANSAPIVAQPIQQPVYGPSVRPSVPFHPVSPAQPALSQPGRTLDPHDAPTELNRSFSLTPQR